MTYLCTDWIGGRSPIDFLDGHESRTVMDIYYDYNECTSFYARTTTYYNADGESADSNQNDDARCSEHDGRAEDLYDDRFWEIVADQLEAQAEWMCTDPSHEFRNQLVFENEDLMLVHQEYEHDAQPQTIGTTPTTAQPSANGQISHGSPLMPPHEPVTPELITELRLRHTGDRPATGWLINRAAPSQIFPIRDPLTPTLIYDYHRTWPTFILLNAADPCLRATATRSLHKNWTA